MSESDFTPEEYRHTSVKERLSNSPTHASNRYLEDQIRQAESSHLINIMLKNKKMSR